MPIGPTRMGWVKLERERVRRWYQKPKWKVPTIHGLVVIIQHASKRQRLTKHYFHFVRVLQKFKFIPFLTTFHVQWRKSHMVSTAKCETKPWYEIERRNYVACHTFSFVYHENGRKAKHSRWKRKMLKLMVQLDLSNAKVSTHRSVATFEEAK